MMSTAQGATMLPQHLERRATQQRQAQGMPVQVMQVSYKLCTMPNVGGDKSYFESYLVNLAINRVKFLRFLRGV